LKDSDQKLITKVELNFKELKVFKIDEEKSFGIIVAVKANLEKIEFHQTVSRSMNSKNI
jgi:hypothetical protein